MLEKQEGRKSNCALRDTQEGSRWHQERKAGEKQATQQVGLGAPVVNTIPLMATGGLWELFLKQFKAGRK